MKNLTPNDPTSSDGLLLAIVHDMRALLRNSLTRAQLLQRSIGAGAAAAREQLPEIIAADKRIERFLGRLADYANAAQLSARPPISLDAALQTALIQFPSGPVELAPAPGGARLVPREFSRVFAELIDNALKFSGNAPVSVRTASSGSQVAVTVRDGGIGVDPSEEERVFEPLVRLHSGDEYPGFGLGLAICRRIADAAGAQIRISPDPDGGTLAIVIFPALPEFPA